MIYFLDNSLQLQKIVTSKNVISAIHEHELNGLIRADVELDLSFANKFLILGIDHVGYYYKDEFYLHKIQRVEYDHVNETATVVLRHIFFEDMIFGKLIQDVRPQNQDALTVSTQTIDANTRWQTIMTDVTGRLSTNFYWQVPYEVIEFMTENYRIEYLPKILFDGQKINGFQLHLANKIGEDKNIRIPYGSRVLDLKYEEDYSEIITKLVVHGKGEEVGDGYGRRINISDVNFSRNGVESPVGSLYLEDESITNTYGNDGQTPREGRAVFEDIENVNELAEAGYQHYLQVSRPQMLFTADVSDIGDVGIGDSVMIIRREYDVYFNARIHKLSVDLLYPEDAQVELGDYKHFKESKIARKTREKNNQLHKRNQSEIERLKRQFDDNFNAEVEQLRQEFEQAKIDIFAEIEADRVNMQNLLDTKSTEWTEEFNQSVAESKDYAEYQAQEKAEAVRTDLEMVTSGHQQMIDDLESNVINIDEFLGDSRDVTLDERLLNINQNFEDRIKNIDSSVYNMLRDTRFDENFWRTFSGSTIQTDETINYARFNLTVNNQPNIRTSETLRFDEGTQYRIVIEYRTDAVPELDYMYLFPSSGGDININEIADGIGFRELNTDGQWNKRVLTFTPNRTLDAVLAIGSRRSTGDGTMGNIDVRLPYLTTTSNINWVYHPLDATQNISEVTMRVTQLEDGYSELTTRNEFDFETGRLDQYIKSVESTVEGNYQVLQRVEDWQATNGASIEETIYGFDQKVWLNDVANIGANLVPQSSNAWENGGIGILSGAETNNSSSLRTKEYIPVEPSVEYTFHDNSIYLSAVRFIDVHQYDLNGTWIRNWRIERGGSQTFTTWSNTATVRIGLVSLEGFHIFPSFIENPDKRIHLKLEKGNTATPMINALSRIEQIADKINMTVVELDGTYLKQSDFQLTPDYWQLGSMRIGADNVSSVLRGSPDALDAVVSNFNLTGNLNAKGQITSLAVDAIEGNFARLFANQLTANVITSDHIQVGTALVDKMFATSARIDELITKTHFVTNVKAMSIEAVDGQFSSLMTKYFSANYIDVDYINGKNAWFETQYTKNANIERLTAQTAFIRDIQAIEITANQLNLTTLRNRFNQIEGGLHITRAKDGVRWIENGVPRGNVPVQTYDSYAGSDVRFNGLNYITEESHWQTFKYFYTPHEGRTLRVVWAVGLLGSSGSASDNVEVRVDGFGNNNQINNGTGSSARTAFVLRGETSYITQDIPLPPPNYLLMQANLQFRRSPSGTGVRNDVYARILHIGQYG